MRLYIGNLPYTATEGDLEDWLTGLGVSTDGLSVVRDRFSGESRGFAFVEIDDDSRANAAIEACNGQDFMGRRLVVNEARPPSGNRGGGGGGGGGGGRGRGGRGGGRDREPRW